MPVIRRIACHVMPSNRIARHAGVKHPFADPMESGCHLLVSRCNRRYSRYSASVRQPLQFNLTNPITYNPNAQVLRLPLRVFVCRVQVDRVVRPRVAALNF